MNQADRPKISIYIAASLDGFIARSDGNLDWLNCVHGFKEDYGFQKHFDTIDALIMGRKTYETTASVPDWPYKDKRVIVLSHHLKSIKQEAELYSGDIPPLLSQLHSDGIKHIWIDGGVTISQFLSSKLVDHLTLSIIPILLGSGVPLFSVTNQELPCQLISSQSYPSGLVQLQYKIMHFE